ncbi:unnamed protein product [Prorocentrum cordatum]|uniref:Uncharacterized protein n=1 Tax=Prorocentrum cordatum TaxID=2364126 RepID=A0ABN9X417_9DINO|nr:unnamed protein product [Polarella glacialis]
MLHRGTLDSDVNPLCRNASGYVFRFFGGLQGLLIILSSLAFFSVLLLTRHAGWRKRGMGRIRSAMRTGQTLCACCRRWGGPRCCCSRQARERCGSAGSGGVTDDIDQSTFRFQKKHAPYHTCRVYLGGQNRRCCRWILSASAPPAVEALVDAGRWESLAAEVNAATAVPSAEVFWERLLGVVYPPLAEVYARHRRLRRAQRLRDRARGYSEASRAAGQPEFWRPRQIHARVESAGRLVMAFGCDAGATLGYLDFFDFSRSPARDWAPVDLRQEVHLLVAHGDGSFLEPFELDIGDPVVQHLMMPTLRTRSSRPSTAWRG